MCPTPWDFVDARCDGDMSTNRKEGMMGKAGEYEQQAFPGAPDPKDPDPVPGAGNVYPNLYGFDATNTQFSQDKEDDPVRLLESTRQRVRDHSDMNLAYGLNQPQATLGTHGWLRDGLYDPTEEEPGNAVPEQNQKVPERQSVTKRGWK